MYSKLHFVPQYDKCSLLKVCNAIYDFSVCYMDDDQCLQQAWSTSYTCSEHANPTGLCVSYAKDAARCCPESCGTGSLTESECNALEGWGTCVYPNNAQNCGKSNYICFTYMNLVICTAA